MNKCGVYLTRETLAYIVECMSDVCYICPAMEKFAGKSAERVEEVSIHRRQLMCFLGNEIRTDPTLEEQVDDLVLDVEELKRMVKTKKLEEELFGGIELAIPVSTDYKFEQEKVFDCFSCFKKDEKQGIVIVSFRCLQGGTHELPFHKRCAEERGYFDKSMCKDLLENGAKEVWDSDICCLVPNPERRENKNDGKNIDRRPNSFLYQAIVLS